MDTSTTGEQVLQLVTFTLRNEEYAVDILNVQEINRITEITQVPNSPSYVEGVINLRGKVMPVIIIIMDIKGVTNGLVVDSVSEVLRIPTDIVEPPPPMSSDISSKFIKGVAKLENRLIILIDINELLGESVEIN
jgi:purine-binding chemotaxis protein CheW